MGKSKVKSNSIRKNTRKKRELSRPLEAKRLEKALENLKSQSFVDIQSMLFVLMFVCLNVDFLCYYYYFLMFFCLLLLSDYYCCLIIRCSFAVDLLFD
jgi:hypothetical protein